MFGKKLFLGYFLVLVLLIGIFSFALPALAKEGSDSGRPTRATVIDALKNHEFRDPEKKAEQERILTVKNDVRAARNSFKDSFKELVDARDRLKEAINVREAQKEELRKTVRHAARDALKVQIEALKKKLKELKDEDEDNVFSDEETVLEKEELTQTQIIDASEKIKDKWLEKREKIKIKAAKAVNEKLRNLNQKIEKFIERIEARLAKLKEKGLDVSGLESSLEEFKANKEKIKEVHATIKEEFDAAQTPEEKKAAIKHAFRLLKVAHEQLMNDFIKIKREIKALRGEKEPELVPPALPEPRGVLEPEQTIEEALVDVRADTVQISGTADETIVVDASTAVVQDVTEPQSG